MKFGKLYTELMNEVSVSKVQQDFIDKHKNDIIYRFGNEYETFSKSKGRTTLKKNIVNALMKKKIIGIDYSDLSKDGIYKIKI